MNANYAETCSVGNLKGNWAKKSKNIFLDKNSKNYFFFIEIA